MGSKLLEGPTTGRSVQLVTQDAPQIIAFLDGLLDQFSAWEDGKQSLSGALLLGFFDLGNANVIAFTGQLYAREAVDLGSGSTKARGSLLRGDAGSLLRHKTTAQLQQSALRWASRLKETYDVIVKHGHDRGRLLDGGSGRAFGARGGRADLRTQLPQGLGRAGRGLVVKQRLDQSLQLGDALAEVLAVIDDGLGIGVLLVDAAGTAGETFGAFAGVVIGKDAADLAATALNRSVTSQRGN